ncbi:MAG: TonB family protein [Zoogloeaceae bacterium]|jgi:protein TonB|nr:TonB family protein [Zoogloeaceae bacterium]
MNARSANSIPLMLALSCSLALHVALLIGTTHWEVKKPAPPPPTPDALLARLTEAALPPQPELALPAEAASPPVSRKKAKPPPDAPTDSPLATLTASARQQLNRLDFYPLEAIQNGWQGEAWVRIFLDENGNVIAARLEASSGYPLLDAAAVNAARSLKSLSHNGLDSALLPVRFKLE